MKKILVLGGNGMLGSMVVDHIVSKGGFEVHASVRNLNGCRKVIDKVPKVEWHAFDIKRNEDIERELADLLSGKDYAINCIGIIKPYIHDDKPLEVERAIVVNSLFPHILARCAEKTGVHVIQIATDCVYSGLKGDYDETAAHDPPDAYGKTKSLGEVYSDLVHHVRCSIVGPEPMNCLSLLEWFLSQKTGATVKGFVNQYWNGVTTLHFAALLHGIIEKELFKHIGHLVHVVPSYKISKAGLLQEFAKAFNRSDVIINSVSTETAKDLTLATVRSEFNLQIWKSAGYSSPPTIPEMIKELGDYPYRFKEK